MNGAYYIYSMGFTVEEALDYILDSIIETKINVQLALDYFNSLDSDYADLNTNENDVWSAKRYLTAKEIAEANYNVKKSVNETIDSYLSAEDEEPSESYKEKVRAVPTGAVNYVHELTTEEMNAYTIDTGVYSGGNANDSERRTAYYMLLKSMSDNGYIDDSFDWKTDNITDTQYYKDSVKEQMETILLNKYNSYLIYDYYKTVSFDVIEQTHEDLFASQSKAKTYTEFNEMLTNASAKNPVLYNHFNGFGYVYNLLIPMDSVQSAKLAELEKNNTKKYREDREDILANTTVKDLRNTWINAGYDFDKDTNKFLNDYAVAGDALEFKGLVEWTNKEGVTVTKKTDGDKTYFEYTVDGKVDKDYVPEYKATSTEMKFDAFITMMEDYLYGVAPDNVFEGLWNEDVPYKRVGAYDDGTVDAQTWKDKINELLFAFSSDDGSLNTYKGYPIAKDYEFDYKETFVEEFASAGRMLLDAAEAGQSQSYIVVASDYGYHVMFLAEVVTMASNVANATIEGYLGKATTALEAEYAQMLKDIRDGKAEDYADNYLYVLQQSVAGTAASNYVKQKISNAKQSALDNESKVKIVRDNLKNIL